MKNENEKNPPVNSGATEKVTLNVVRSFLSELLNVVSSEYEPEAGRKLKQSIIKLAGEFGLKEGDLVVNDVPVTQHKSEIQFVPTEAEKQFLIAYSDEYDRLIAEASNNSKGDLQTCLVDMAVLSKIYLGCLKEKMATSIYHLDALAKAYRDYLFSGKRFSIVIVERYYLLLFSVLGDAVQRNEPSFAGDLYMEYPYEHALDGVLNFSIERCLGGNTKKLDYSAQAMNKAKQILFKELDAICEAEKKKLSDGLIAKGKEYLN